MLRHVFSMCCLLSLAWPVMAQIGKAAPSARPSGTPAAPQPPAPDKPVMPPVATVIDAFIAATGGQAAYEAMRGLERRYTWVIGDDTGATQVRARPGGAFLLDMTMRDSAWHEGQGSNGAKTWLEDAAGECFPAPEIVAVQLRMEHDPTAWLHLDRYVRISAVSDQVELLGRPHWRLILVPLKGRSWYAYFDVESGLLSRFEFARPGDSGRLITVERKYSDWKSVGSIALPHAIEEHSVAGTVAMTLREAHTKTFEKGTFALSTCAEAAFNRLSDELPARGDYHAALIDMIGPTLVDMQGQQMPSSILADQPDVLLYFTAKWCGPCRRFTPKLVEFYNKNAGNRDFMVVVVSSDRSKDQLAQYLKDYKMPFPAVPFERRDTSGLKKKYGARGIPNLVWLDGQDEMVQSSYEKGIYVGPDKVLSAFSKHMGL
jgi:thiol-disulfide isomerase/thioredoxin